MGTKDDKHNGLKRFILFLIVLAILCLGADLYRNFDALVEGYQSTRVVPESTD
ncbi:hypothetical protein ACWOE5_07760 [Aerococcus sanguinicola]|uniref:hypothetical protein n=1 Tax=Aerococcus TaxID=1375 RepID=UPI000A4CCA52|nr:MULTISPECIES: hypothetical protein [Aerococcus]MDK7050592.1 hypothetical protein [Aerococcus sanguinicola]